MQIIHVDMSEYHRGNLRILSEFLKRAVPPPKFSMESYLYNSQNYKFYNPYKATPDLYKNCGTVACAVGHGPLAGINAEPNETWKGYSLRVFGSNLNISNEIFVWCFDARWCRMDNTPKGAAARIDFLLEHNGVPDDYILQMYNRKPLCYTVIE